MQRRLLGSTALLLGLCACNGTTAEGGGGAGTTGPGTTGPGTTTSTPTGTTSTASGATVTLTMDSFTVPPGGEVYYCQNFANPFGGVDANVQEFESHMAVGSHHMLLFYEPGVTTNGALETCSGLEFAPTPYASQTPDDVTPFPAGVAALIPGTDGLRIQSHYLNTTTSTIDAHVEVIFHVAEPGTVQYNAGVLFLVDTMINVPPESKAVDGMSCTLPQDMNIIRAASHMHQHGTNFVADLSGTQLYQTTTWTEPMPEAFTPPTVGKMGDTVNFACSFTNNTASPLTFGESALTNEMCIFIASFYPTPPGVATIGGNGCTSTQM
jgi:hypothetical protein